MKTEDAIRIIKELGTSLLRYPTKSQPNGAVVGETISTIRGVRYRQSVDAPVDGILIHPLVMGQMLSDASSNEPVDIYLHTYDGKN